MTALRKTLIAGCVAASLSPMAHAEKFFSSSSVTLLHSADYQGVEFDAGGNGGREYEATYFTFENVTVHNWGGTFFFIDRDQPQGDLDGTDEVYGEFAPNLSLGWLTGQDLSFGPVKDVTLAGPVRIRWQHRSQQLPDRLRTGVGCPGLQLSDHLVLLRDQQRDLR